MFYLVPLIIIVICLGLICYIIFRKFPQAASLDLEHFEEEWEVLKKREILRQHLETKSRELKKKWKTTVSPLGKLWGKIQLKFRIYVGKVERLWRHEEEMKRRQEEAQSVALGCQSKITELMQQADNHLRSGNLEKAEEFYIAVIKLDKKNIPAYRRLGETYLAQNSLDEALQTYLFLCQLAPNDDVWLVKIAEIYEKQGKIHEAIQSYQQAAVLNDSVSTRFFHLAELLLKVKESQVAAEAIAQAVEIEPKNPQYLDLMIEIAIICNDKILAQKGLNDLRLINSKNKKLDEFRERISKME